MMTVAFVTILLYASLIVLLYIGSRNVKENELNSEDAVHSFSVIVVFRNEEDQLSDLVRHFENLEYSRKKFEVLLIDDASEDNSLAIAQDLKKECPTLDIVVIEQKKSGSASKKDAIERGVELAKYDWIITTDADCSFEPTWLHSYDSFLQSNKAKLIAGPVACGNDDSFIQRFQTLDFLSLQGSTMGSFGLSQKNLGIGPLMCNGANLCYEREAFKQLDGYEGNKHLASGDDVFLLEKMYDQFPEEVWYLKSRAAIVKTVPKNSWIELVQQRIRWASKTSASKSRFAKFTGLLVFLSNLSIVLLFIFSLFNPLSWTTLGIIFLIKFNIDFALIYKTSLFFDQQKALSSYLGSSIVYPFFTTWVAIQSIRGTYTWKGRSYRR